MWRGGCEICKTASSADSPGSRCYISVGGGAYLGKGDQVNEKLLSVTTVPEIRKEKRDTLSGFRKITMITYNLLHFTAAR